MSNKGKPCIRCLGSGKEPPFPIQQGEFLRILVDHIVQGYCTSGHADAVGMLDHLMAVINAPEWGHERTRR